MTGFDITECLRGPWTAVIFDTAGFAYDDPDDLIDKYGTDHEALFTIVVVRGSAAPVKGRRPGGRHDADVAHEVQRYFTDVDDKSAGVPGCFERAKAMAAGLNAAAADLEPGFAVI